MPEPIPATLAGLADAVVPHLREHFTVTPEQQVIKLCGETGEFAEAYARWAGMARRSGTLEEMAAELADVVITAYVAAKVIGFDLDEAWQAKAQVILSRGWREEAPCNPCCNCKCEGCDQSPIEHCGEHATSCRAGCPAWAGTLVAPVRREAK